MMNSGAKMFGLFDSDSHYPTWQKNRITAALGYSKLHPFRCLESSSLPPIFASLIGPPINIDDSRSTFQLARDCIWRNDIRNRQIAAVAKFLAGELGNQKCRFQNDCQLADLKDRLQQFSDPIITVVTENPMHLFKIKSRLNWPRVMRHGVNLDQFLSRPYPISQMINRNRIMTVDAIKCFGLGDSDVLIWAGGGRHFPLEILRATNNCSKPVQIVDFRDSYDARFDQWSRRREIQILKAQEKNCEQ